jgi:hypothetical protein
MTEPAAEQAAKTRTAKPAATLASALVAAQANMPTVAKDAENPHFKSKFVSLDALIEKTRPVLNGHGLALVQFPTVSDLGAPVLRTILIHGPSGEQLTADMALLVTGTTMQQLGSAITYARRYAWAAVLGVATEADDDGNSASPKVISDDQRRRLFTIAGKRSMEEPVLRDIIKGVTGSESTKTIPVDKYDQIVEIIQADDVPF